MDSQLLDNVKLEKEEANARFNRIAKLRQFCEVLFILGLIWWTSPPLRRAAAACAVDFSSYLFNHHVVFLIGNAIIASLFLLCRNTNDAATPSAAAAAGEDLYNDYILHSEAATAVESAVEEEVVYDHLCDPAHLPPTDGDHEEEEEEKQKQKQIVVCRSEERMIVTATTPQCDDVAEAIEKATRQIKRFERTQSERLKREITPSLRRSETQNRRNSVSCDERLEAEEIERLSSEEFRRTVDDFIDKHWCRKKTKQIEFDDYEKYELMELA